MNKNPVIFYGAGAHALMTFKRCSTEISPRKVVAFCDRDTSKYSKKLLGLPIMSLESAKCLYSDFNIYITANEFHAPAIIAFLLENGVSEERIINHRPIERARGCVEIENYLVISPYSNVGGKAGFCCGNFNRSKSPFIELKNASGLSEFFELRDKMMDDMANHTESGSCFGCPHIREHWRFKEKSLRGIRYGGNFICNCKCTYCSGWENVDSHLSHIFIINVIDYLENHSECNQRHYHLFPGEIAIHPQNRPLLEKVKGHDLVIGTNATIYSEALADVLSLGRSVINVSLDSGTRETYNKVKGIDAFDKVRENLHRYAENGKIVLKYIFMQGVNDTDRDLDGFFSLADAVADNVVFSRNYRDENDLSDHSLKMIDRFINHFNESELILSTGEGEKLREGEHARFEQLS